MKITFKKDLRNFKAGTTLTFNQTLTCLVGSNGCGKTTLFKALRGLVNGVSKNLYDLKADENNTLGQSIVLQEAPQKIFFISKDDDPSNDNDAYTFVSKGGMDLNKLSEGEKFDKLFLRTADAVLRAASEGFKVLMVTDEVDAHFDLGAQKMFFQVMKELEKRGVQIIIITHNLGVMMQQRELTILKDGKLEPIHVSAYYRK